MRKIQNYIDLTKSFLVIDVTAILSIFGYAIVNHKRIDEYQLTTGTASVITLTSLFVLLSLFFLSLAEKNGD
jgi:hypothetical protein